MWLKANKKKYGISAEQVYQATELSRQSVHRIVKKQEFFDIQAEAILSEARRIRQFHPTMSARVMYKRIKAVKHKKKLLNRIGRDKFEQLLFDRGFRVHRKANRYRTTIRGPFIFANLIGGKVIRSVNRVWMSDITYLIIYDQVYYITTIIDVYSRRLLGYAVSENMRAVSTVVPALKMALQTRSIKRYRYLIFHSDGGRQYVEGMVLEILKAYHIQSSMAGTVYENPFIERLHSTIKNDYLLPWGVLTYNEIRKAMERFDYLYNHDRGHQSVGDLAPVAFERLIKHILVKDRLEVRIKKVEQKWTSVC